MAKKTSPKRRKSIAVTNQNKPISLPTRRRRAHSTVGVRLSPASKARSLAPRKSILKASLNVPPDFEDTTIDPTTEYTTAIHDNPTKSFGSRRVSFAEHAHVRLFAKERQQNTNSTASPESSPLPPSPPAVSDENAYPGSSAFNRRRSSLGIASVGGSDMDIDEDNTVPNLSSFVPRSSLPFGDDDIEDDNDMDMTTAIEQNILRKRSLSGSRQPLSLVPPIPAPEDTSTSQASDSSEAQQSSMSFSTTEGNSSQPVEYTVPMGKALRPQSGPSQEWLALRSVTHSGDTPYEPPASDDDSGEGMELTEALSRLSAKRASLRLTDDEDDLIMDETIDSTESSLTGMDEGDRTINVTGFLAARASMGRSDAEDMSGSWPDGEDGVVRLPVQPSPAPSKKLNTVSASIEQQVPKAMSTPKSSTIPRPLPFSFTPIPSLTVPSGKPSPLPSEPIAVDGSGEGTPKPKPLSPSKKALWQSKKGGSATKEGDRPMSSLKKHLAQRKSFAGGIAPIPGPSSKTSPKKMAVVGERSIGGGPSGLWAPPSYSSSPMRAVDSSFSSPAMRVDPSLEISVSARQSLSGNGGMGMDATAQWRDGVEYQSFIEEARAPISISDFFQMTDIRFMDEITAPRRSMHPSSRPSAREPSSIPLAEYVVAVDVDTPQLELYSHVSNDLQAWIEKSRNDYQQAEEEAAKVTPELFDEFREADEEGQTELLHQLKLIKANTHASAKSEWYDWKLQWVESLYDTADKGFAALEADCKLLEEINSTAKDILPALRAEYEQVMRELEQEQAEVAEIENCDQDYLNELRMSIAEQNTEVEALKGELSDGGSQLKWLQDKVEDLNLQKREATTAISEARRIMDIENNSTTAEIFRLKGELEGLEKLHMWRAIKVDPTMFEFIYHECFRVSIPCIKFRPVMNKITVSRVEDFRLKFKDAFPQLSEFLLHMAKEWILSSSIALNAPEVIQRLSDYWSSCTRLRTQLKFVAIKFPLSVQVLPTAEDGTRAFASRAVVIFVKQKAKAVVSFVFDADTFSTWPMSIRSVKCDVEIVYGLISRELVLDVVQRRLNRSTPAENHTCLLEACIEASESY